MARFRSCSIFDEIGALSIRSDARRGSGVVNSAERRRSAQKRGVRYLSTSNPWKTPGSDRGSAYDLAECLPTTAKSCAEATVWPRPRRGSCRYKKTGSRPCDLEPSINTRQRPTLPHSYPCSTIGGRRLNFRVRNGNGCDPSPMTTGNMNQPTPYTGAARHVANPRSPGIFSGARATTCRRLNVKERDN